MVGVAQLVEPRIVIPVVVGSSPIVHPINADVAELVDALDLGSSAARCGSSSLPVRTKINSLKAFSFLKVVSVFPPMVSCYDVIHTTKVTIQQNKFRFYLTGFWGKFLKNTVCTIY